MSSRPSHTVSNREVYLLSVLRVAALAHSQLEGALRPLDLTVDRWRALMAIQAAPGGSMADVIEALVMPATSATRAVDALVELGAVFRTPSPEDRRRVTLRLSAVGLRKLRAAQDLVNAIVLPDTGSTPGD